MTITTIMALLGAMLVLAAIPGPGVIAVVARSLSGGLAHGAVTVAGIIVGDFVFILLAIYGLSAMAEVLGHFFFLVKYIGGAYLIWLGIDLLRSTSTSRHLVVVVETSWRQHFMSGFLVTLGNPKAILFYVGFFPAFLDLSVISPVDIAIIMGIATFAIGGVMFGYAYMASRAQILLKSPRAKRILDRVAGGVMMGTGTFLIART